MSYNNQMNAPSWFDCFNCAKISPIACEKTYAEFYWQTAVDAGFVPADLMYMKDTIIKEVLPSIWPNGPYELFTTWTATFNPIAPLFNRYSGGFSIQEPQANELRYMVSMIYQWFAEKQVEPSSGVGLSGSSCTNGSCSYPFNRYDGEANSNMSPIPSMIGDSKMRIYCPEGYVYDPNTNMCVPKPQLGLSGCGCGCNHDGNVGALPKVKTITKINKNVWDYIPPKGTLLVCNYYDESTDSFYAGAMIQGQYETVSTLDWWSRTISASIGKDLYKVKYVLRNKWKTPEDVYRQLTGNKFDSVSDYTNLVGDTKFVKSLVDTIVFTKSVY